MTRSVLIGARTRRIIVLSLAALVVAAISAGMAGAYGPGSNCFGYDYATNEACSDAHYTEVQPLHAEWNVVSQSPYAGGETQFESYASDPMAYGGNLPESYDWHWGDGTLNTQGSGAANAAPTHVFASTGDYDVRVTVTFADSRTATFIDTLKVAARAKPYVSIENLEQPRTNVPLSLSGSGMDPSDDSNAVTSYDWSWGDASAHSTTASPSHTWTQPGHYLVTLTVTFADNQVGTAKQYFDVTDLEAPLAQITLGNEGVAGSTAATLYAYGSNSGSEYSDVTSYAWSFDGGTDVNTGTDPSVSQMLNSPGEHSVHLLVTFEDGRSAEVTEPVYVQPASGPTLSFWASGGTVIAGSSTSFQASAYDIDDSSNAVDTITWNWDDGSSDSTGATPNHTFAAAGLYVVRVHATFTTGSADDVRMIYVNAPQSASASFWAQSADAGKPVDFNGSANGGDSGSAVDSWSYDFNDPNDPTAGTSQNPTHVYSEPGQYLVTLTVTFANSDVAQYTEVATVYEPSNPTAGFYTDGALRPLGNVYVHANVYFPDAAGPVTYDWNWGDSSTHGTGANPSHQYATTGEKKITLTATDGTSSVSVSHYVTIGDDRPTLAGFAWRDESPVVGSFVTFTGVAYDPDDPAKTVTDYSWNFGDGSADVNGADNHAVHKYTTEGDHTVTLTVTFSDTTTRERILDVWVNPLSSGSELVSEETSAGGTVTTGDDATPANPISTDVTPSQAGAVTVEETPSITEGSPTGYSFFGQQVNITAPDALDQAHPLRLSFLVDGSVIPAGSAVQVFRNGVMLPACSQPDGTTQTHLPCLLPVEAVGSDIRLTVLTMRASNWNFGNTPSSAAGSGDSTPTPTPAADVTGTPAPVVVTPAAPAKPATPAVAALSLSGLVAKTKLGVALLKGLKTTVKCSAACKFTAQLVLPAKVAKKLKLKTLIAKASGSRTKAGSTVVTLKFTTAAKKALKKLRSVKATLVLTSGKTVSKKAVTLKR